MNHNPYNLVPGDIARLDSGKPNSSLVLIVSMSPQGMYSRVVPASLGSDATDAEAWDVMTSRLTVNITQEL